MAKRFTDTDKWKRPWFRNLDLKAKVLWFYLLDSCDHAGIWIADFEFASFAVGFKFSETDLLNWFSSKIVKVDTDKFCILSFFDFQYGHASEKYSARVSASKILKNLKILNDDLSLNPECLETPQSLPGDLPQSPSISISMGIGMSISKKESDKIKIEILAAYDLYPRKEGKSRGIKKLLADIKSIEEAHQFRKAVEKYKAVCEENKTEPKFIKLFSTFASDWRDCLDPEFGTSTIKSKKGFDIDTYELPK